jgi:hypothetical protein
MGAVQQATAGHAQLPSHGLGNGLGLVEAASPDP